MAHSPPVKVSAEPPPSLEAKRAVRLRKWRSKAATLIGDRLADARAHAAGGKPVLAHARVAELGESLRSLLADVRGESYRFAVADRSLEYDPAIHDGPPVVDPTEESVVRESGLVGHGDQYAELEAAIEDARRRLRLATSVEDASAHLQLWESTLGRRLSALVDMHLSDAQMAIHELVGQLMLKPEYR